MATNQPLHLASAVALSAVGYLLTESLTMNTASVTPKVIALRYSPDSIRAALIALKGSAKGAATFEAVAPVFSALVVSGGSKPELMATSATAQVFKELHSEALKTPTAKAFRACAVHALVDFTKQGRAKDQDSHDTRMLELSGIWCAYFRDTVAKTKPEGYETPTAKIARLEAENATLRIERDAMAEALKTLQSTTAPLQTA